jgi:hypothetical protein
LIETSIPPLRFEGIFNVPDNLFEEYFIVVSSGFFSILQARGSVQLVEQILPVSMN